MKLNSHRPTHTGPPTARQPAMHRPGGAPLRFLVGPEGRDFSRRWSTRSVNPWLWWALRGAAAPSRRSSRPPRGGAESGSTCAAGLPPLWGYPLAGPTSLTGPACFSGGAGQGGAGVPLLADLTLVCVPQRAGPRPQTVHRYEKSLYKGGVSRGVRCGPRPGPVSPEGQG